MEEFYTDFFLHGKRLFIRGYDESGNRFSKWKSINPRLYVPCEPEHGKFKTLEGKPLASLSFNNPKEARNFADTHPEVYGFSRFQYSAVDKIYPGKEKEYDESYIRVAPIDIETECEDGFPDIDAANERINVVTVGMNGEYYAFSLGPVDLSDESFDNNDVDRSKIYIIECDTEYELLSKFVEWWRTLDPDIVTGWNCVPLTNTVWSRYGIKEMYDVMYKDSLYDSFVEHVFPITNKDVYRLHVSNGEYVDSSSDHVFPIWYVPKGSYIDPKNKESLIQNDITLTQLKSLLDENNVYVKQEINNNTRCNLTWRELFINNLDEMVCKGVDFFIRDSTIVRKMSKAKGYGCYNELKASFWSVSHVIKCIGKNEIIEFFRRNAYVKVYYNGIKGRHTWFNLDEYIEPELLWMAGMLYTDGTSTYNNELTIYNSNGEIIDECNRIANKLFRQKYRVERRKERDDCAYIRTSLGLSWVLKLFGFEHIQTNSLKSIDYKLLSQLSCEQFSSFIGGCIDGDGSVDNETTRLSLHVFNGDAQKFAELLRWNGIFSIVNRNGNCVSFYDPGCIYPFIQNGSKRERVCRSSRSSMMRTSKSDDLRWIDNGDSVLVKVTDIEDMGFKDQMIDISTSTSYFITSGFKTHNCQFFDLPYLVHRMMRIGSEEFAQRLSPFERLSFSSARMYGKEHTKVSLCGIATLDYIDLYKKFKNKMQESYKLDHIASVELGTQKLEYEGSMHRLYKENFSKWVAYNIQDVYLIDALDEKLKYVSLACQMAYMAKVRLEDVFSAVRMWDVMINNYLVNECGIQVPFHSNEPSNHNSYDGAYVKEPLRGWHDWVCSFDLASLYPSLIMQYNIGPDTLLDTEDMVPLDADDVVNQTPKFEQAKRLADEKGAALTGNGSMYSREQKSFMAILMERLYKTRKQAKNTMLDLNGEVQQIEAEIHRRERGE